MARLLLAVAALMVLVHGQVEPQLVTLDASNPMNEVLHLLDSLKTSANSLQLTAQINAISKLILRIESTRASMSTPSVQPGTVLDLRDDGATTSTVETNDGERRSPSDLDEERVKVDKAKELLLQEIAFLKEKEKEKNSLLIPNLLDIPVQNHIENLQELLRSVRAQFYDGQKDILRLKNELLGNRFKMDTADANLSACQSLLKDFSSQVILKENENKELFSKHQFLKEHHEKISNLYERHFARAASQYDNFMKSFIEEQCKLERFTTKCQTISDKFLEGQKSQSEMLLEAVANLKLLAANAPILTWPAAYGVRSAAHYCSNAGSSCPTQATP